MRLVLIAVAATFASSLAMAAEPLPAQSGPQNPAMHSDHLNNANMPVAGANSYTRGEATSRIAARGYIHISYLNKDAKGVWRGNAKRHGKTMPVSLDFQGNVFPQ